MVAASLFFLASDLLLYEEFWRNSDENVRCTQYVRQLTHRKQNAFLAIAIVLIISMHYPPIIAAC
jgi:hypothetical protein